MTDVVVVGAGVIGAACAYELAGEGLEVTVLERGDAWGEGCSWGNAGMIVPSHARPIAAPESLRAGLKWMLRPDSPFGLKPRPSLLPWLARYIRASTAGRAAAGETLQRGLAQESLALLRDLASTIEFGFAQRGFLSVYTSAGSAAHAAEETTSETGRALNAQLLSAREARELEPALSDAVEAAVLFPDEAQLDPVTLVGALGAAAVERGAELRTRTEVVDINSGAGGVRVQTTHGEISARHVVIAAGAWSGRLSRSLGFTLPMQGGKGYAAEWGPEATQLQIPIYLHEERCVATRMGDRIRMTGGLLLDGLDESYDPKRVAAIRAAGARGLAIHSEPRLTWRGLRPCTPDGLPVIGTHDRAPGVVVATGHGMLGVTLAPLTGKLVTDLIRDRAVHPALGALSPERF